MPAWFDLKSLDPNGAEDEKGIEKAKAVIDKLIEEEIKNGIEPSRIILGGFSQGGALAIYTTLTNKHKVGGLIALSCWLPLHKKFPGAAVVANRDVPCLQVHGDCDPVVPYRWGQLTSTTLKAFMSNHEFKTYKGLAHTSSAAEMQDVKDFLQQLSPAAKEKK
jgi:lysophospholipase-2